MTWTTGALGLGALAGTWTIGIGAAWRIVEPAPALAGWESGAAKVVSRTTPASRANAAAPTIPPISKIPAKNRSIPLMFRPPCADISLERGIGRRGRHLEHRER
jgi:hypothetical protein